MPTKSYPVRGGASRVRAVLMQYHPTRTEQFAADDHTRVVDELIPDLERHGRIALSDARMLEIGSGQR